jgi:ABC-type transport system involved in cytochrome c biogenesis permease subunit
MQIFSDYQLPIFACFLLFFAMLFYWVSLSFPKTSFSESVNFSFRILCLRYYSLDHSRLFPLSNLYESLIFLS